MNRIQESFIWRPKLRWVDMKESEYFGRPNQFIAFQVQVPLSQSCNLMRFFQPAFTGFNLALFSLSFRYVSSISKKHYLSRFNSLDYPRDPTAAPIFAAEFFFNRDSFSCTFDQCQRFTFCDAKALGGGIVGFFDILCLVGNESCKQSPREVISGPA